MRSPLRVWLLSSLLFLSIGTATFATPTSRDWEARTIGQTNPKLRRLTNQEIAVQLRQIPGWSLQGKHLICLIQVNSFVDAVALVQQSVAPAEAAGHHPDILIRYNQVTFSLTTHDAGGITQQDFDLAAKISALSGFSGCKFQLSGKLDRVLSG